MSRREVLSSLLRRSNLFCFIVVSLIQKKINNTSRLRNVSNVNIIQKVYNIVDTDTKGQGKKYTNMTEIGKKLNVRCLFVCPSVCESFCLSD